MRITTPEGYKVKYLGVNGCESDLKFASDYLQVGSIYTVERMEVGTWCSSVFLKGIDSGMLGFNSVMFENVDDKGCIRNWFKEQYLTNYTAQC